MPFYEAAITTHTMPLNSGDQLMNSILSTSDTGEADIGNFVSSNSARAELSIQRARAFRL